jgi:hypothetical protein
LFQEFVGLLCSVGSLTSGPDHSSTEIFLWELLAA